MHADPRVAAPDPHGQSYVELRPLPALAGLVSPAWIQQIAPGGDPYTQRNIPNGSVELLCAVGSAPRLVGPLTQAVVEVLAPGTTIVGVRFHPGAAAAVLGLPASELVDLTLDADELGDRSTGRLAELVDGAGSPEAVRQLRWRTDDLGSLSSALYVSERQLRRRCQDAVGVGPKTLHRMLRCQEFLALAQHAIAHGRAPTDDGLALLAAEAGYADQPHLNRECLRLTGMSPGSFLGEAEATCACGHDHSASFAPVLQARARPPAPA